MRAEVSTRVFSFECVEGDWRRECLVLGVEKEKAGELGRSPAGHMWVHNVFPLVVKTGPGIVRVQSQMVCLPIDDADSFGWIRRTALHESGGDE